VDAGVGVVVVDVVEEEEGGGEEESIDNEDVHRAGRTLATTTDAVFQSAARYLASSAAVLVSSQVLYADRWFRLLYTHPLVGVKGY